MVRKTASTILMEILGGLILLVLVLAGLLVLRLASGPIDLSVFRKDVEEAIEEARDGRPVSIGRLQLEWSQKGRRLQVAAEDLQLMDAAGRPAAEASHALIQLAGSSLIFGDVEVLALDLTDGWIAFDQVSAKQWAIAGDPLPEFEGGSLPASPQAWIDQVGKVLPEWLKAVRTAQEGTRFEHAGFENFEMRVRDVERRPIATIEQASGRLARSSEGVTLSFSGSGLGSGLPGSILVRMETDGAGRDMRSELTVTNWPLADFGARLGLDPELTQGVPSDIHMAVDLSEESGIELVKLDVKGGAGQLSFADRLWPVRDLDLSLVYDREEDRLGVRLASRGAGPFRGTAEMAFSNALTGTGFRPFELTSPAVTLDITPVFEAPLELASVRLRGEADIDQLALRGTVAEFAAGGGGFRVSGDLARTPEREAGQPPVLADLEISATGAIPVSTVYAFWPVELGGSARRFATGRVTDGVVQDAKARLKLQRDSFRNGYLRDEHLEVTFRGEGVAVQFLDDLPAVEEASGNGRLTGNTFRVTLREGNFSRWRLSEGVVDFPAFDKRGQEFRVFAKGRGDAEPLMRALVESRLDIPFDPARISGQGEATFEMFRPALNDVPYEDVRFTATGTIREAGLKNAALGFDLSGGAVTVDVDPAGATVSGNGRLGPSPVNFRWHQGFRGDEMLADVTADGTVTADFLNRFGILGRAYMTGEAPLKATAKLRGDVLLSSQVDVDLTPARLDMSEIGWVKPAGEAARAEVDYALREGLTQSRVKFTSATARLDGDFTLGEDSRLIAAQLREAFFRNVAEVGGSITRGRDNTMSITLNGKYLDISGLMPGIGDMQAAGAEEEEGVPLRLAASVERLTLRPGLDLSEAKLLATTGTNGLLSMEASGLAMGGAPMQATLSAEPDGLAHLRVTSGDAGFLASALLGADFLTGGQLDLSGTLETETAPANLVLQITNGRMKDAPFLTQILSLASLRGLTDTLSGEGVLFSRIEVPMKVSSGRYVVTGAKAQGPALGLTASGFVDMGSREIEIDGVLVPSFGVNSALGGIPIIGDLVVGRDGEGVFSLTYSVRGTLEKANVAVNPLSALAPGVIRRVFENPSDTRIPEATPRPDTEPLPTELPPIKEETF